MSERILPLSRQIAEHWGRINVPNPLPVVDGLLACENPWHCPHRRPIVVRLGRMEIEKRLGRR